MPYQTTSAQKGHSDSPGKLNALRIPEDLSGRRFLDLGCNEGFFCDQARKRNASQVVGVDVNEISVKAARENYPDLIFLNESWWTYQAAKKFDYILISSALHYEPHPRRLCTKVANMLTEDGTFILEAGVVIDDDSPRWHTVDRHDGRFRYPTLPLLRDYILGEFAVRYIGPSVTQPGDPIARHVFHCNIIRPTVLVITGPGGSGKSVLSRQLSSTEAVVVSIDSLVVAFAKGELNSSERYKRVVSEIRENFDQSRLDLLYARLGTAELAKLFAEMIIETLPGEARLNVIEGYAFEIPQLSDPILKGLAAAGFRVWVCRSPGDLIDAVTHT